MELTKKIIIFLVLFYIAWVSNFWNDTSTAFQNFQHDINYSDFRDKNGFGGLSIFDVQSKINSVLPREVNLALDDEIIKQDFWNQRLTEGLYPRVISPHSNYKISFIKNTDQNSTFDNSADKIILSGSPQTGGFYLSTVGSPIAYDQNKMSTSIQESLSFGLNEVFYLFISLFSTLGFGKLINTFIKSRLNSLIEQTLTEFLFGVFTVGIIAMITCWLQIPVHWLFLAYLGAIIFILLNFNQKNITKIKNLYSSYSDLNVKESSFIFLTFILFFLRVFFFPVILWDGRSIWFYHAKKLFFEGIITKQHLLAPENFWSLPDKPLTFPALLNIFTAASPLYNERLASLAIPFFLFSLLTLNYIALKRLTNTFSATIISLCFFLTIETLAAGGYADPFIACTLFGGWLRLNLKGDSSIIAILFFALCSTLKLEGLVFSLICIAIHFKFNVKLIFTKISSTKNAPFVVLSLLIAPLHATWSKLLGFKGAFGGIPYQLILDTFFERWSILFNAIPSLLPRHPVLWPAAFLVPLIILLLFIQFILKIKTHPLKKSSLQAALSFFLFSILTLFLTPHSLIWHISTALDRLLLHPSFFILLASVL